jgi:hypothetical protein
MAYSDFDLKTAVQRFGLTEVSNVNLFADIKPIEPSESLQAWIKQFAPVAIGLNTEMARSTYIITPILGDAKIRMGPSVNVLPGVTLDVDKAQGLSGFCDYLIARSPGFYYLQAPVVAVVEAKKEDLVAGMGQCAAEMIAIRIFNEREGTTVPAVFGCVTSGTNWRFLKLEESKLFIDEPEYYLHDVSKIIGILVTIGRG